MKQKPIPQYKALTFLSKFYLMTVLASTVLFSKLIVMGPLTMCAGSMIYPLTYFAQLIITEVYGYEQTKKEIWNNVTMAIFFCAIVESFIHIPSPHRQAFEIVLSTGPRYVAAGVITTIFAMFICAIVFSKLKMWMVGKNFFLRAFLALLIGESVGSYMVITLAFLGTLPLQEIMKISLSIFLFKISVSIILLFPVTIIVYYLKIKENSNVIDFGVNMNPFKFG